MEADVHWFSYERLLYAAGHLEGMWGAGRGGGGGRVRSLL